MKTFFELREKTLTKAELKKREEVAKAIERENPNMPMDKKMAIATATAKKVAEEVEELDEISRDTTRSYIRKAHREYSDLRAKDNKTPDQDKKFKKREAGIELAGKKTYNGFGTPRVQATESAELDEGIANLSNARLKYHVTKNFPHGSYTKAEIENEHKRRLRVEPEYHKAKPSLSEAIDDVSSFGTRKLSSIANSPNHPDRVAAKNELNRRRMRNEEAELGEATVQKWDNVKVNKPGDQHHGHKGVINRSKFGAHTVTFKNGKTSVYDSAELVKEDLDEAKKPRPSNNALVLAKNLEKIKAAIKKEEVNQIDEISQKLKDKYVQRSMDSHTHMSAVARDSGTKESDRQHLRKKMKDRNQGMARAFGQTKDTW